MTSEPTPTATDILNAFQDAGDRFEQAAKTRLADRAVSALMEIERRGYAVRFVEWGEDAETPGLLGSIRGVTSHAGRWVKIATRPHETANDLADTIEHELRHVVDPLWDCGSRNVWGNRVPAVADTGYLALRTARRAWKCEDCGGGIAEGQRYVENLSEAHRFESGTRHCGRCSLDNGYLAKPAAAAQTHLNETEAEADDAQ